MGIAAGRNCKKAELFVERPFSGWSAEALIPVNAFQFHPCSRLHGERASHVYRLRSRTPEIQKMKKNNLRGKIAVLLKKAQSEPGWTRNTSTPWEPIKSAIATVLNIESDCIHACKVQLSSARKSLWQGRLHRSTTPVLLVAADSPCDDSSFDRLAASVVERFNEPSRWADACIVISNGRVVGCVERQGCGLADWLKSARRKLLVETCGPVDDQAKLGLQAKRSGQNAARFIQSLERAGGSGRVDLLSKLLSLSKDEILVSSTSVAANASKGRWEGSDVDPSLRYRVALVASENWDWGNAAVEIIGRMEPADLSIGMVMLYAEDEASGRWDHSRCFISQNSDFAKRLTSELRRTGLSITEVETSPASRTISNSRPRSRALRVRDSDVGDITYEVSRPKQRIHDLLTNWLAKWALENGYAVEEGDSMEALYDARIVQYEDGKDLLIEAKSTAELGVIRLAVGQLLDYSRVLKNSDINTTAAILLPLTERVSVGQMQLLNDHGIARANIIHKQNGADVIVTLAVHYPDGRTVEIPD